MSGPNLKENDRTLYLEEIHVESNTNTQFRVKLQIDSNDTRTTHDEQTLIWKPLYSLELTPALKITVIIKAGRSVAGISFGKQEARVDISGQGAIDAFWESRPLVLATTFENKPVTISLQLHPSPTARLSFRLEATYEHMTKVQDAMKQYKPLMESSTEQRVDIFITYGATLSEVNPRAKMAFHVVRVTFDMLQEQSKHDALVLTLATSTGKILAYADRILEDAICDEVELLEPVIKKLCSIIVETAAFICEYVKKSATNNALRSSTVSEDIKIKDLQGHLIKLEEDLDHAVSGATLKAASDFEKDLLLKHLDPVDTANYHEERGCMEGTRVGVINDISTWATKPLNEDRTPRNSNAGGVMWLYGMPGIGKSSIAHSICRRLHESKQLGRSFFCRRDDPVLSETKMILPTLIYGLAGKFGPGELFVNTLKTLRTHPPRTLVLVIDALDECGEPATRRLLLEQLVEACKQNHWLRLIVTSRPEHDIQAFFNENCVSGRDLSQDDQDRNDIRHFTETRMKWVANKQHQNPKQLIGEGRLGRIVNRSGGLFIFVETLSRYLVGYRDPKPPLNRLLQGPSEEASVELHKLYLAAIELHIKAEEAEFRLVTRVVIGVAPHRALCDESIAAFTGVELASISSWVDDLGSLLYRDKSVKNGIRVRHTSILEYLIGSFCPLDFRVDLKLANIELSTYCLQAMITGLRFNICGLETSYLPNSGIKDLKERVERSISDILQYSCLHWASHLCTNLDAASKEICDGLGDLLRSERILYWLEVLSMMGEVPVAIKALRRIIECSRKFNDQIVKLAEDALRFVFAFAGPISTSAPHIYLSALPFTPVESSVWKNACKSFPKLMRVSEGRMEKWPTDVAFGEGHTGWIECVAYSADGESIVSVSWDETVRIWDAVTGAPVGDPLKGHDGVVTSVAYSPDGRNIASGSWDKTILIWDAATGALVGEPLKGHTDHVLSVAYSPDGRNIVSGSDDGTLRIWNAVTGASIGEPLRGHAGQVAGVAYSPDGRRIVSGSWDDTVRMWDAVTGSPIGEPLNGHTSVVTSVAYSPDGRNIASGSWDKTILIWDAATGVLVGEPLKGHTNHVLSVAYSPDGQKIASGSADHTIRIWNATTGAPIGEQLEGNADHVTSVAYSPDGTRIVSGSHNCTIRVWDAATGASMSGPSKVHNDRVTCIAYSPDGRNVVSGFDDNTIRIWDVATGEPVGEPLKGHTDTVASVAYSPDGQNIASGSYDFTIRIWDAKNGAPICGPLTGCGSCVPSIAYSPDGREIASGSVHGTIQIWDTATGSPVGEPLKSQVSGVRSVIYSPDGRRILSACARGIQIWDAATRKAVGEPLKIHTGIIKSAAFSQDGGKVVSSSANMIQLWDVVTGTPIGKPLKGNNYAVMSVAYSPDGKTIASGSLDSTLRIWDAATGAPIGEPLKGHTSRVTSVAYSPDGGSIVSGSWDCTIRIWDAATGALVANRPTGYVNKIIPSGSPDIQSAAFISPGHSNTDWATQETPSNNTSAPLGRSSPSIDVLDKHSSGPFGPDAVSGIALDPNSIDSDGWVRREGGNLLWIPEDCREGVTSPAIRIISTQDRQRCVRLDLSNFKYGTSWTDVYEST
ncbi:hypothetical protein M408DRAFT_26159 [Serendipita vermifera MAFF 305830]|uniref:Nephrocystin 3-like N-terminal domain-containing protein n=1 Tax=Serendipita vermifera MAFF 305830 TaxID=933852 RepID=A0A0C2X8U5_SERVB|nr:hypothetical protein M408DRAFT_26159 [Serendipita vermifera MAFF 305830]